LTWPLADQFLDLDLAVDQDADVRRLVHLAQQGDLVDGQRGRLAAALGHGLHAQRVQLDRVGLVQSLLQAVLVVAVHQEADVAELHAVNRQAARQEAVQGAQHEAVAAERDDDVGLVKWRVAVALRERGQRLLGAVHLAGDEMDPEVPAHRAVIPRLPHRSTGRARARPPTG